MPKDPSVAYLESVAKNINMILMTGSVACHTVMCSQCPFNLHSGCFLARLDDLVDDSILIRNAVNDLNGRNKHVKFKMKREPKPEPADETQDGPIDAISEAIRRYLDEMEEGADNNETDNS